MSYIQRQRLGGGSFGDVYVYEEKSSGQLYAVKHYKNEFPEFNEIDILSKMEHPNILHMHHLELQYDSFHRANSLMLYLPLADSDMNDWIQKQKMTVSDGNLTLEQVVKTMHQIISAIHFFHQQSYFHCDLKPQNILMFGNKPVVADFGWSYQIGYNSHNVCGTIGYSSPQCIYDGTMMFGLPPSGDCDSVLSDIFSLGSIFFELITGITLINFSTQSTINQTYTNVEQNLLSLQTISSFNSLVITPEIKQAFECIYRMCRYKNEDRIQNIQDILTEPIFVMFGLNTPIPGRVKMTKMPYDLCCVKVRNEVEPTISMLPQLSRKLSNKANANLCQLCIFQPLLLRALNCETFVVSNDTKDFIAMACTYLTTNITKGKTIQHDTYLMNIINGKTNIENIKNLIYKITKELEGCLTIPTIYSLTENGMACVYYLCLCLMDDNCDIVIQDPKKIKMMFDTYEASNVSIKQYAFSKYDKNINNIIFDNNNKTLTVIAKSFIGQDFQLTMNYAITTTNPLFRIINI